MQQCYSVENIVLGLKNACSFLAYGISFTIVIGEWLLVLLEVQIYFLSLTKELMKSNAFLSKLQFLQEAMQALAFQGCTLKKFWETGSTLCAWEWASANLARQ